MENTTENVETNKKIIETPKKKRGRKPKPKPANEPEKVKKKRGRKPKPKVLNDSTEKKNKKKDKSYGIINMNNQNIEQDNIIIHLPIKTDNIKNNLKEQELLTYDPNISIPTGYENRDGYIDNVQFLSQKNNPNDNTPLIGKGPPPNPDFAYYPFDEKQQNIFEVLEDEDGAEVDKESSESIDNNNKIENEFIVNHNKQWYKDHDKEFLKKNEGIDKIMDYIKKQREEDIDSISIKQQKNNIEKCLIQFEQSNKSESWPSATSIYCWWCCHPFNGPPCALPYDYCNNKFKVLGVFCSPECAAAYNFEDIHSGYDLWERYALLNLLYRKVYNDNNIKIKLAPPKQVLKIFGGNLSIKEFRLHNTNYNNIYKILMPPMVSVTPIQEITNIDNGYSSKSEKKIYMIDKDKLSNEKLPLKLKRSKPFNVSKNTLEKCMLNSDTTSVNSQKSI